MLNAYYVDMLGHKSVIRELSEYATERKRAVGEENVYDFSLCNPSVPAPDSFNEACIRLMKEEDSISLHGYSPSVGIYKVRKQVAESLERRFGIPYGPEHIFPTAGAAGAIAHALRAVTTPGDEVLIFAPYFPEYGPYVTGTGAKLVIAPARMEDFQLNLEAAEELISERTAAVLINSPNNPSGVVYTGETLEKLAALLTAKSAEYGHEIFLVADEPYREIAFDNTPVPYTAKYYKNTLTCYSFSKSLSIPGERIGYVAVHPEAEGADILIQVFAQISRGIGHNCPSSLIMRAMGETVDDTSDLAVYERNMNLLYDCFTSLGFTVPRPGGTFYIMPKALEEDSAAFCRKALKYDLVFVPADGFGAPGYFRIAYCVTTEMVERAIPVIERFVKEEYGK